MENQLLDAPLDKQTVVVLAKRLNRFCAFLIDIVPITLLIYLIFFVFFGMDEIMNNYLNRGEDIQPRIAFLQKRNIIRGISFVVWLIYSTIMDASKYQGTFGKQVMGIQVIDEYGTRLSLQVSLLRNLGKLLSSGALWLGFIWILLDKQRQGWHDKMAKTLVITK